jgi:hypothetical protein
MPLSTSSTDPEVLSFVDIETHLIITHLREELHLKRLHLALRAPDVVHATTCANKLACSNSWDCAWLNSIGRKVLHPDIFRPNWVEIRDCAENLEVPEMHAACFKRVSIEVQNIQIWGFESERVQAAVDLLMVPEIELGLPLNASIMS